MPVSRWVGVGAGALATTVVSKLAFGRVATTVIVARQVWKNPVVQKIRRKVQRRIEKERAAAHRR